MHAKLSATFESVFRRPPEFIGYAPGRIEFIGNHTDYNGGPVLGASLDRGVMVALARRSDGQRRFVSNVGRDQVVLSADRVDRQTGATSWINYPLGVLEALPAFDLRVPAGFDYAVTANLPAGAGLSSSAAIELASALVFLAVTGQSPTRETLVKIGRHAENHFVGVPCGILDQGVSGFGQRGRLVHIDCRGPFFSTVPLPEAAHFWVFNTHTKHALVDGLYAARHRECMEAARVLGVPLLAEASLAQLEAAQSRLTPEGARRARHVIGEVARVGAAVEALRAADLAQTGRLLTASHHSSQTWFENSTPELDFLVAQLSARQDVFGARLTGGGFGGAVMAMTSAKFDDAAAREVADAYRTRFGAGVDVLHTQTGEGAQLIQG